MNDSKTRHMKPTGLDGIVTAVIQQVAHELTEEVTAKLSARIGEEVNKLQGVVVEKPMTQKEAAGYLGVTDETVYRWISNGTIPPTVVHKVSSGRTFLFASELRDFIKKS